jgi:hypothetical protein
MYSAYGKLSFYILAKRYLASGLSQVMSENYFWNNAHSATLEDYKLNEKTQPLYTPEAKTAQDEQDMRELQ